MIYVSDPYTTPPQTFLTPLQEKVYVVLEELGIPYQRVETDEVITMEDCGKINEKLDMKMVKTLFLCDRRQSAFYLFVTKGDKAFHAKDFGAALGVSRVSFAPVLCMEEMLGTKVGAATVMSMLLPGTNQIRLVLDQDVLADSFYGCSDGTTTGYLKLATQDLLEKVLPYAGKTYDVIQI